MLGATPIQAVGSTVPAIMPGSISGAYRYWREGLVDWRVGLICGGTGALFAAAGAKLDDLVDAHYLMILTAGLLAFSGVSIIRTADAAATEIDPCRPPGRRATSGRGHPSDPSPQRTCRPGRPSRASAPDGRRLATVRVDRASSPMAVRRGERRGAGGGRARRPGCWPGCSGWAAAS